MPATDRLYNLMPAFYRERDAEQNYPLRALLRIIESQRDILDRDIQGLYDDLFIETCAPWVVPYIGDLVSNDLLFDSSRIDAPDTARALFPDLAGKDLRPPVAARTRADVAKTVYYRRRKGTPAMLEELARDVTGWPAHAVEFFQLLGWTQHVEHFRAQAQWTDVRSPERTDRIHGAFDETSHTVDVRNVNQLEGWHNIRNIGFFLWRLRSYPLQNVPARRAGKDWQYHFSPLGNPAPLFSRWRREGDESGMATELHVPGPIRRFYFQKTLDDYRDSPPVRPDFTSLYGAFEPLPPSTLGSDPNSSIFIVRNGVPFAPTANPAAPVAAYKPQIICRRLDPWPAAPPTGRVIAVDVQTGRLAIGDGWADATTGLDVYYHYGFMADLGGGPYERRNWLVRPDVAALQYRVKADGVTPAGSPPVTHTSVAAALADWASSPVGRPNAIISILDSRTYALAPSLNLRNEGWLVIEAANGERPLLQTDAAGLDIGVVPPAVASDPARDAALTISGVVVEGFLKVSGDLGALRMLHATLVPGRSLDEDGKPATNLPSLTAEATSSSGAEINAKLKVELAFSITGPLKTPDHAAGVWALDSVVDGLGGIAVEGAPLTAERSTFLGAAAIKTLQASECVFTGKVEAVRRQEGCVRFCYVPPGSHTPRLYRCQPGLASDQAVREALDRNPALSQAAQDQIRQKVESRLVPAFTARRYGQPAYAQLHLGCPLEIRTGAEDGSEMGAFCHVKQPQRESNLKIRLREYLPFGLEPGVIYVT